MIRKEYYKWWVVVACSMITALAGGIFHYSFTAFFNPIAAEFQWSYALVALAFSFRGFESGVISPLVGIACDKFGPKIVLLWGVIITGLGYIFVSVTQSLLSFYLIFIFLGVGISLSGIVVTMTVISRWFGRKASLAMGILTAGIALGGLMAPVITFLIDSFGWRQTGIIMGVAFWLICIPLVISIKNKSVISTVVSDQSEDTGEEQNNNSGLGLRQIMKSKVLWILSTAVLFSSVAGNAITVHQMPHLINVGISRQAASFAVSVFAVSNMGGRLLFGIIGDRFDKRRCFAIATLLKSAGVILLALVNSMDSAVIALMILGIGFGGIVPLRPGLQIQLFGIEKFGSIQGLLLTFATIGSIVSPPFAGWMFDIMGDYKNAFLLLGAVTIIAIPLVLSLPREDLSR